MRTVARLVRFAKPEYRGLVQIVLLSIGSSLVTILGPWPLKLLVDHALTGRPAPAALSWIGSGTSLIFASAAAGLALFVLHSILDVGITRSWAVIGRRLVAHISAELFARLQRLSLGFHSRRSPGEALSRISADSWGIYTLVEALLVAPVQHLLTIIALGAISVRLDPLLGQISLLTVPVLAMATRRLGHTLEARTVTSRDAQAHVMGFLHQALGAIPVIQAFNLRVPNGRRFSRLATAQLEASQREAVWKAAIAAVNGTATAIVIALVLYVGGRRVLSGAMTVGSLLVFLGYQQALQSATQSLWGIHSTVRAANASIRRVFEVLDARDDVPERQDATRLPPASKAGRSVAFDGVSFGYTSARPVLRDVSLQIPAGEVLALIGATGAGKSTLAALVPRFYVPWDGRVLVDSVDVAELRLADLRRQVALVPQEPFLFPLSVAENIALGASHIDFEAIEAAARAANAHQFISRLPDGYRTVLGEGGARLSGGQRQRLAIARALLKDAPILILDEPTSALDAESESLILDAWARLFRSRTVIIISHRLSALRLASRVVVLDDGRVVDDGSPADLLRRGGPFKRIHDIQLSTPAGRISA